MSLEKVSELLQQEMSRKEFLRMTGIVLLSAVGITSMLNNLRGVQMPTQQQKAGRGYGYSAYGR